MYEEISNSDFVARYCSPSTIDNNILQSTAFALRHNEEYISVNCISSDLDIKKEIKNIQSVFTRKKFHTRANGKFVVFNVGIIKHHVYKSTGIEISVRHRSSYNDPTHAGISMYDYNSTPEKKNQMRIIADSMLVFIRENPSLIHMMFSNNELSR